MKTGGTGDWVSIVTTPRSAIMYGMNISAQYVVNLLGFPKTIQDDIRRIYPHWRAKGQKGAFVGQISQRLRALGEPELADAIEDPEKAVGYKS
jgi:hypothetical protein